MPPGHALACLSVGRASCRVHHRTADSAVGVLSLNLVVTANTPAAAAVAGPAAPGQPLSALGAALAAALEALAPRCTALPLSVGALNSRPWWPRRDQNTQRLVSGPLQLALNTQASVALGARQAAAAAAAAGYRCCCQLACSAATRYFCSELNLNAKLSTACRWFWMRQS